MTKGRKSTKTKFTNILLFVTYITIFTVKDESYVSKPQQITSGYILICDKYIHYDSHHSLLQYTQ
jgi:hypothetical protein